MPSPVILRIALPGPLRTLFDYLLPLEVSQAKLLPGIRIMVPFGRGMRCGMLLQIDSQSEVSADRLKPIESIIDQAPLLSRQDINLLNWAAEYYQHPLGDVIFHALPTRLRKGKALSQAGRQGWRLTVRGKALTPADLHRAVRQRAVIETLRMHPHGLTKQQLVDACGECTSILRTLRQKQWIEPYHLTVAPEHPPEKMKSAFSLTVEQQSVVDQVVRHFHHFQPFLLDGVTGSGKTEVYLNLIRQAITRQQQVLVLAPEIGLTPQLVSRFEQRLGQPVTLIHSGLSELKRERAWLAARSGDSQLVVGTRSAVFTPMPRLGLIIVDEEHDLSFKQQEGFRYSARDLAIIRAKQRGCPILLGSATPSLESLRNVQLSRYPHLQLAQRAGSAQMPHMDLLDIRSVRLDAGLSPALIKQIHMVLQQGHQVMLFLNRRGFAPVVTCHACGWLSDCPRCDARMTLHKAQHLLWCHHCGHQRRLPEQCPSCGSPDLVAIGQGTERLEQALQQHFADIPIARIDRDTTSRQGSLERLLRAIRKGEYPLLLGTQMLAKGHHFPDVTLVGLIDVDQGLCGADYRASERMAQLIIQVAGRAGRAEKPGRVLIQTRHPDHPLLQTLVHQGYPAFARQALEERRLAMLPPYTFQVLLRAEATHKQLPSDFLEAAAKHGKTLAPSTALEFWGPVPAPMERRDGKVRAHLLIQTASRKALHSWLKTWVRQLDSLPNARRVRWSVDVDPMEMY